MKALTEHQIIKAYTMVVEEGMTNAEAARILGIGVETVGRIVRGERHRPITEKLASRITQPITKKEVENSVQRLLERIAVESAGE